MSNPFANIPPEMIAALAKDNQSPKIIAIVATFTAVGFVAVVLRFFSRIKLVGVVGMEDYTVAVSLLFSILSSTCLIQGARYGNGRHLINVIVAGNVEYVLKYLYFGIISYHVTLTMTKVSILLQYRRIFTLKQSRMPIYIVMGLCIATGITAVFSAIFTCVPVDAYWDLPKKAFAKCINQDAMYHANAALNMTTDLLVAALPVRALWKLQIAMRQKIALLAILTLGWFVVVLSALRLYFLVLVSKHQDDQTWYSGPAAYWSAIEVNLAIVCASAPALKPLIITIIPVFGSRFGSKPSNGASDQSTEPMYASKSSGPFMRLQGKNSQSSTMDDVQLETGRGVTALPNAHSKGGQDRWKEIHVTQDFEQRSVDMGRESADSQKEIFGRHHGRR